MIIAIDETGTFSNNELGMFVAIFIKPSARDEIEGIFKDWEKSVRKNKGIKNELKSSMLDKDDYSSFVEVVIKNKIETIKYICNAIEANPHSNKVTEAQRSLNIDNFTSAIEMYLKKGGEFKKIAHFYQNMKEWLSKVNTSSLMKIQLLGFTIVESLNAAIVISILKSCDAELADLEWKIDESFLNNKDKKNYWLDLLRNQFWAFTYGRGIIRLKEWGGDHPFEKTFIASSDSTTKKSVLKPELKQRIEFVRSHENYEVRIADIVAGIYKERFVKDNKLKAYDEIKPFNHYKNSMNILVPTMRKEDIPNPYIT